MYVNEKIESDFNGVVGTRSSAASAEVEQEDDDVLCEPCENAPVCEEGARVAKFIRGPTEPTADEMRAHNATHVPYRYWCPFCVGAAAKTLFQVIMSTIGS